MCIQIIIDSFCNCNARLMPPTPTQTFNFWFHSLTKIHPSSEECWAPHVHTLCVDIATSFFSGGQRQLLGPQLGKECICRFFENLTYEYSTSQKSLTDYCRVKFPLSESGLRFEIGGNLLLNSWRRSVCRGTPQKNVKNVKFSNFSKTL